MITKRNSQFWFIVVTYRPNVVVLNRLLTRLGGYPVMVVDNTDSKNQKSKTKNQKYKSHIKYIKTKTNLGYGEGANRGIKDACKKGAKWVVVLNQDLVAAPVAIKHLVARLNMLAPGIAGPLAGVLDSRRYTTIIPADEADYISGSCIAIHKDVIRQVGYFYEPYFLYYEEVDLCLRAKRLGFPMIHLPVAGISHEESVTFGKGSFVHQYYLARNHLLFVERQAPLIVKIHEFLRLSKTVWEHYRKQEIGALYGIRDYFLRRFGRL